MRVIPFLILGLIAFTPALPGQVLHLGLRAEKAERKHKSRMIELLGRRGLLVEAVQPLERTDGRYRLDSEQRYEFYLADPRDPEALPYRWKKGLRVPVSRSRLLVLRGQEVRFLEPAFEAESFASFAAEYRLRMETLAATQDRRDRLERGGESWLQAHRELLRFADRCDRWLRSTGYAVKADALAKAVAKDARRHQELLVADRLRVAIESISKEPKPAELAEVEQELTRGSTFLQQYASRHFRIVADKRLDFARVEGLLGEAEAALEDFRLRHVDPWLGEEEDPIPAEPFLEFFFGPEQDGAFEGFLVLYYGQGWGPDAEQAQRGRGLVFHRPFDPHFVEYWRHGKEVDLDSVVLHGLGHALAELRYVGHGGPVSHDWLREALGLRVEWERRGRSHVVCVGPPSANRYGFGAARDGWGTGPEGLRARVRELAVGNALPLPTLLLRELGELNEADVAMGWSFYEWIVSQPDGSGERWLRRLEDAGHHGPDGFLRQMRAATLELFALEREGEAEDPLRLLEGRWRSALEGEGEEAAQPLR